MKNHKPKICPKCGDKRAEFYHNLKTGGYLLPCKVCKRALALRWIANNRGRADAARKVYRESHREQRATYMKQWAANHPRRKKGTWEKIKNYFFKCG